MFSSLSRMNKIHLLSALFIVFICGCHTFTNAEKHVVCFVTSWAVYRTPPYKFTIEDIDPKLCTHLVYGLANVKADTADDIVTLDSYADLKIDGEGLGQYTEITELKKNHPQLKISLGMGGNNDPSINYSRLSKSSTKRKDFARNAVSFLRQYNFDGLDIFWKFPGLRGGISEDKENFPKLLQEIRQEFNKNNLLLTVTLTGMISLAVKAYELPNISRHVDWIHLNEFAFTTPWNRHFGINSPMESNDEDNIKSSVEYFLNEGVPNNKIVLSIPAFGYGFTNAGSTSKAGAMVGLHKDINGYLAFHEICEKVNDQSEWTTTWDVKSSTPITSKQTEKISFDNQKSVEIKVAYIKEKNFLGAYLWSLDHDDFKGLCLLTTRTFSGGGRYRYPILKTINQELGRNTSVGNLLNVTVVIHDVQSE